MQQAIRIIIALLLMLPYFEVRAQYLYAGFGIGRTFAGGITVPFESKIEGSDLKAEGDIQVAEKKEELVSFSLGYEVYKNRLFWGLDFTVLSYGIMDQMMVLRQLKDNERLVSGSLDGALKIPLEKVEGHSFTFMMPIGFQMVRFQSWSIIPYGKFGYSRTTLVVNPQDVDVREHAGADVVLPADPVLTIQLKREVYSKITYGVGVYFNNHRSGVGIKIDYMAFPAVLPPQIKGSFVQNGTSWALGVEKQEKIFHTIMVRFVIRFSP